MEFFDTLPNGNSVDWSMEQEALKANPNKWAVVYVYDNENSAQWLSANIRCKHRHRGTQWPPGYDARVRKTSTGQFAVWARWIGDRDGQR